MIRIMQMSHQFSEFEQIPLLTSMLSLSNTGKQTNQMILKSPTKSFNKEKVITPTRHVATGHWYCIGHLALSPLETDFKQNMRHGKYSLNRKNVDIAH